MCLTGPVDLHVALPTGTSMASIEVGDTQLDLWVDGRDGLTGRGRLGRNVAPRPSCTMILPMALEPISPPTDRDLISASMAWDTPDPAGVPA